jgi:hypothetical protein
MLKPFDLFFYRADIILKARSVPASGQLAL